MWNAVSVGQRGVGEWIYINVCRAPTPIGTPGKTDWARTSDSISDASIQFNRVDAMRPFWKQAIASVKEKDTIPPVPCSMPSYVTVQVGNTWLRLYIGATARTSGALRYIAGAIFPISYVCLGGPDFEAFLAQSHLGGSEVLSGC